MMDDRGPTVEAIELLERTVAENLQVYTVYADITEHFGLRRLLLSVAEQILDHLDDWQSVTSTYEADELFAVSDSHYARLRRLQIPRSFDADMRYHDFLTMLGEREGTAATMYTVLGEVAIAEASRTLCRRHASDSRRNVAMAQDRFDLEVMLAENQGTPHERSGEIANRRGF